MSIYRTKPIFLIVTLRLRTTSSSHQWKQRTNTLKQNTKNTVQV